jgi:outer membrane protein insertion porin family
LQAVPEMGGAGVLLKIRVQENAPVTQFAFQGNTVLSTEDLSHIFADQLGKPQNLTQLSQSIERIEQAYRDKGFVLARVTDVKDDPDGSVNVKIDEGSISSVQIVGNKKTKDFIIRNALKVKSGDVYNERQLTADLRKLFGNGYFNDIRRSLTPDPANPDKYQLKVEVDEKRTGSVGIGGGVDTIAGPFGNFSFSDSNFRGRGQILSFNSQLGTGMLNGTMNSINNGGMSFLPTGAQARSYQFEASFVEPNFRGGKTSVGVSGFARNYASMMVDEATQRTHGGSITLTRPLKGHWTGSLAFTGESTSLRGFGSMLTGGALDQLTRRGIGMGMDPQSAAVNAQNVRNTQLAGGLYASFKPTLYYDTRDSGVDPRKGTFAKITGGPSIGITGNSFGNLGVSVSKFVPVTKETTLAMNMQGGAAMGGVPQFAQYRLGGWNGVRGYDMFSALGTGTGLLMASAELRRRLPFIPKETKNPIGQYFNKNVKAVAFADLGGVSGNQLINNMYQRSTMAGSVGLGLRVNIPMLGLVRFDYGFPLLSSALGKLTPRFTIGFGDKF